VSVRVAIVGAGPAGAYAAGELLRRGRGVEVDIFERLPTPWGLLRAGVAPDHQEIKILARHFEQDVAHAGCRFFGNVEIGRDIAHDELMRHYAAVVYASGAQAGKALGVPGEDLPGSLAATEFVGWYNGHPDHRGLAPDLSCTRAAVIGNGNVAADVARILLRDPSELEATDIADHALDALRVSRVREVVVVGRRGPAQAAFTNAELHELGTIGGVDVVADPAEAEPDALSQDWLESEASFTARRNVELIRGFAARRPAGASRRLVLRFLRAPVAIRGRDRVEGVELCRTELLRDDHGAIRAHPTEDREAFGCGLVLRSVGYRAVPLPGVPFDERRSVLPNERGRVAPGVYAVGWIKRGPTGILGTNKRDAEETVRTLLDDLVAGRMPAPEAPGSAAAAALVARAKPDHVSFAGWRRIDDHEVARGRATGRPRVKHCEVGSLLEAAGATPA
jgi:ferredoxin/flavodoxin---NADP+ reductase